MNERREKRKRWIQRGEYAVEVEVVTRLTILPRPASSLPRFARSTRLHDGLKKAM